MERRKAISLIRHLREASPNSLVFAMLDALIKSQSLHSELSKKNTEPKASAAVTGEREASEKVLEEKWSIQSK